MGENTKIEWCDHSWNPWVGCTKISPACDHCYAEGWAKRAGTPELWTGERRRTSVANWKLPIKWNREAALAGVRRKVFCASLADVFDNQAEPEWRADLWQLIRDCPSLDWQLLTKRPQNIAKMLPPDWNNGWGNVWLGTTAESQDEADKRLPHLVRVPARVRFVSAEPLLGPIDFTSIGWPKIDGHRVDVLRRGYWNKAGRWAFGPAADLGEPRGGFTSHSDMNGIDWIIVGGESGPGARSFNPEWARSIRNQCKAAGTAFFMKQMGGSRKPFAPIPDDLMVREFPNEGGNGNG